MLPKGLRKESRVGVTYILSKNKLVKRYIHQCVDCGSKMLLSISYEKTHTGFCGKCYIKHKPKHFKHILDENGCKPCNICLRTLHYSKFLKRKGDIFSSACSKCHNLKQFGINSIQYDEMLEKQNGKCAICLNPETANDKHKNTSRSLAVDHCHKTGKVRSLICTNCNLGIGHFKDDIQLFKKAIQYLTFHSNQIV